MSREEDVFYKKEVERLKEYLNVRIGFNYNKTWHCASFWTNISTPINLSLTLLTALLAADASSTGNLISRNDYMILSFTTMILTTINSYFKPHIKSADVNDTLTKWIEQGHNLETLEFSHLELKLKYDGYIKLLNDTNSLIKLQASKDKNFLTDGFHAVMRWYRGVNKEKWIKNEIKPENHVIDIPSSIEMSRLKK
jgi:hypothetical protein